MFKREQKLFVELIQVAIGERTSLTMMPTHEQWTALLRMSQEQAICGICFDALSILYETGQRPSKELIFEWIGLSEQIKARNRVLNKHSLDLTSYFAKNGFRSCILKGQGNALYYPKPLSRTSGDIDIWLDGNRDDIESFVRGVFPNTIACNWHIEFPIFKDVPVEVHFIPSYSRSPKFDKRLQLYFEDNKELQFCNRVRLNDNEDYISVPTPEFGLIQQLSHVMRHFFVEGIGMRQMMDIYYLIESKHQRLDYDVIPDLLKYLGLYKFTTAVMWVMRNVFNMEEKFLVCPTDARRGKLLLDEIMRGGNWGHYNKSVWKVIGGLTPFVARSVRFATLFPYEAIITSLTRKIHRIR